MPRTLYLLLHHHHLPTAEDPAVPDLFEDGEPLVWDDNEDCVKVLGLYTTLALAEARIERARELPGFRETPDGFIVHPYVLDQPRWLHGFQLPPGS
ncbi:hypothetical protein ACGF12_34205 [Kitasatospora sp. NPDC048296]|uniref:hypothetical protein n=1 Tax=Kitasatospora sp. NPDC048296 TaxID=3364048 RepID=UPI00371D63CE